MTVVPSLPCDQVVRALRRNGWVVVRQRGSHIRLQKHTETHTLKLTVPAHRPIKRTTLSHILKQAKLTLEEFEALLWHDAQGLIPNPHRVDSRLIPGEEAVSGSLL